MKRKTSATVIMYTVLVFFFVIWIFPIYTAITKSLQAGGWNSYLSVITIRTCTTSAWCSTAFSSPWSPP